MWQAYTVLALLLAGSCAPPQHGIACVNLDPNSGVCRDAELRQAKKDAAQQQKAQHAQRFDELKHLLQQAQIELATKKNAIVAATDPQEVTRLTREHDEIVRKINGYILDASFSLNKQLGPNQAELGQHTEPVTLHLKQDEDSQALLPILTGLDAASEVQLNYSSMQHQFPADAAATAPNPNADSMLAGFASTVQLPPTLKIPLQLQYTLAKTIYCGTIVIAANRMGGDIATQLSPEEGC